MIKHLSARFILSIIQPDLPPNIIPYRDRCNNQTLSLDWYSHMQFALCLLMVSASEVDYSSNNSALFLADIAALLNASLSPCFFMA